MNMELDPNVIAAEFIKSNIDEFMSIAKDIIKETTEKIKLNLDKTYRDYLVNISDKCTKTKSFLLRGEPVALYNFYVQLDLLLKNERIKTPGIKDITNLSKHIIITGSAGCGKSMFVKHLLCNALIVKEKVPIFIELRQFNEFPGDLFEIIVMNLKLMKFTLSEEYIKKALIAGHFIIYLDGYDEIAYIKRKQVGRLINEFIKIYDKNTVIVTSRPEPELEGWQNFSIFKVLPLTVDQAYELVEKLPFDGTIKSMFQKELRESLYEKHKSFLSNPLLLSIMLLTYGQSAAIPNKLNIFYNQAFEALFERHDTLKEGFRRDLLTTLDIQDFGRLFSAFCLQSYDIQKTAFTELEALEYIERSQNITTIKCKKDDYLNDLIQAVCLLIRDGIQIVFAHRSFQEYFTARYIAESQPHIQQRLIEKYKLTVRTDNVMRMLYEMRPEIVEQYYIIPGLENMFSKIGYKNKLGITHFIKYIKSSYEIFVVQHNTFGAVYSRLKEKYYPELIRFTLNNCGNLVGWEKFIIDEEKEKEFCEKYQPLAKNGEIDIRTVPYANQFLKDISKTNSYFSLNTLNTVLDIKKALDKKNKIKEKSLEDILKTKQ